MTAPTPDQMRALADERGVVVQHWGETKRWGKDVEAALRAVADRLEAVQEALSRHPKCDKYDEDDVVSCGWKSAVRDITVTVTGKADAL